MIDSLRQYLLNIVAAAMICAIVSALTNKNSAIGAIIKLLSGIFMTICVVSPLLKLDFSSFSDYIEAFSYESEYVVSAGTELTDESIRQSIKENTEAYIVDKAASLSVELTVEVTLSEDSLPVPERVSLAGNISPYAKTQLSEIIAEDLGIPKENQLWT